MRARAVELAEEFELLGTVVGCAFEDISGRVFDLVINATSASLQEEIPPIPRGAIGPATLCYDMAYGKGDTVIHSLGARASAPAAPKPAGACWWNRRRKRFCFGAA